MSATNLLSDLWKITTTTIPIGINILLEMSIQTISIGFLGQVKDHEHVAGAGVGISLFNIVGLTMLLGTKVGLQTLISTALGMKNTQLATDCMKVG